jgi:acyl-CoA dehydrogenase
VGISTFASEKDLFENVFDAALHAAESVDADHRFPTETFAAARESRLLGVYFPTWAGGEEYSLLEVAKICERLAQACASSALIFAMHNIQVACLRFYGRSTDKLRELSVEAANEQLLLGSVTTERTTGGDMSRSTCAILGSDSGKFTVSKDASVVSYGAHADVLFVTARTNANSAANDQRLLCLRRGEFSLTETRSWFTLGMRGTASAGFQLDGKGQTDLIVPMEFSEISSRVILPVAHTLWGAVWTGIAMEALRRAAKVVRKRPEPEFLSELGNAKVQITAARQALNKAASDFDAAELSFRSDSAVLENDQYRTLKVSVSENCLQSVLSTLRVAGLEGYREDSPTSIARHLRDILSSIIMINNLKTKSAIGQLALF